MKSWKAKKLIGALEKNSYVYSVIRGYNYYRANIHYDCYNILNKAVDDLKKEYNIDVDVDGNVISIYFEDYETPQDIFNGIFSEIDKRK